MNSELAQEKKGNILVVDDIPVNLLLLSKILTQEGYEVRKAINGQIALRAAQAITPDLILLDIDMPGINGYEVCQKLKAHEQTRDVPVIFLSAKDDECQKVQAFAVGGVDYITKPFQYDHLVACVQSQLRHRKTQN